MLLHWIESDLFARQGKAVTNFKATLPPPQSDLASELVRDPYNFDFLTLREDAAERELEQGLLDHIRKFLLELGAGFAFVGQQIRLEVDGEGFYIDLLFYHLRLRCYIVIDLKARPFQPEFAGQMNFYLSAVDDLLRHPDDQPSIGLILCKSRKRIIAEYALRDLAKPVGVAKYVTRLVESLPRELARELPSVEQIGRELGDSDPGASGADALVGPLLDSPARPRLQPASRSPPIARKIGAPSASEWGFSSLPPAGQPTPPPSAAFAIQHASPPSPPPRSLISILIRCF
jgi:predicted nuclease of restriction endonuclease-like (RecB) superfamily